MQIKIEKREVSEYRDQNANSNASLSYLTFLNASVSKIKWISTSAIVAELLGESSIPKNESQTVKSASLTG